ncbi:atypical membrane-integrating protein (Mistic protein) [Tuberibacillus sp. Marseille-P3662]|uniref:atypical membrane-integrating protein (Mistic protein) n=1 Tax=Tuberibacillus sp. Marseille-P3662 TaxID=1965358 RepID=UPI000A1C8798|nr:atypical membrane-integrating protein (Mistic protein) [Tuberibacillus sp. Marseille-P3662]
MKANEADTQSFSDAIDQMNQGLEDIIEIYNNLEEDVPVIHFDDEVLAHIEKAKQKFGEDAVDQKLNAIVKEMLSWLPLDDEATES